MRTFRILSLTVFSLVFVFNVAYDNILSAENVEKPPTVLIAVLVSNKEHILPYFLTYLQNLSYPKDRIALWFRSYHNLDNSTEIVKVWLKKFKDQYHHVDFAFEATPKGYKDESSPTDWHDARYNHLIALKEEALSHAKRIWADFLFMLDPDALLTYPETLSHLVSLRLPIVAPKLFSGGSYSNFWCGMSPDYQYKQIDKDQKIINDRKVGYFKVPMVYSAVLINLNYPQTDLLTFDKSKLIEQSNICPPYTGPLNDLIIFAVSANCSGVPIYISNEKVFGYITKLFNTTESIDKDKMTLLYMKTLIIINDPIADVLIDDVFSSFIQFPEKHKLTLDHIYMINLERRFKRRFRMENLFRELGLEVEYFPAIDGRNLSLDTIKEMGIEILEGYEDPYKRRKITKGLISRFLSHYRIWEHMVEKKQKEVLILEHDVYFNMNFTAKALSVLEQARNAGDFDIIFFGRAIVKDQVEPKVENTKNLAHAGNSYYNLGYVLTLEGAKKLLTSQPLKKLLPVDEFLCVMYNKHHNDNWSAEFSPRNLTAYSAVPHLLYPADYWEQDGLLYDIENSEIIPENILNDGLDVQYKSDLKNNLADAVNTIKNSDLNQIKHATS